MDFERVRHLTVLSCNRTWECVDEAVRLFLSGCRVYGIQELSGLMPLILYTILWETGRVHAELWWGDLMERDHLEDLGIDGRVLLKWIVQKWDEVWIGSGAG